MSTAPIASAWVELVPEMRGFQRALSREMDGATRPMREASRSFVGTLGRTVAGATLAVGAAVAGVAVTVAGIALKGGLDRALQIEQAEAKLTGLGHSAESVSSIMEDALNSVRGTAFGLGDAATVAATIVASGVRPGQELEDTLRLVADAATIAGTDMSSMGAIFAKVAASNKLQMDTINQLHDAGIPALQLVADELGVTAEEAARMASAGEISFETFSAAMEEGLGGAALSAGETFTGAMANVRAALSRLGEKFWTPVLEAFTPVLGNFQGLLDDMGVSFEGAFSSWGEVAQTAADKVDGAITWLRERLETGFEIPTLGDLLDRLGEFSPVLAALGDVVQKHGPAIMDALGNIGSALGDVLGEAVEALLPVLPELGDALVDILDALLPLIPPLADLLVALLPIIPPIVDIAVAILEDAVPAIADLVEAVAPAVGWLADFLTAFLDLSGAMDGGMPGAETTAEQADRVRDAFRGLFGVFGVDFDTFIDGLGKARARIDEFLQPIADSITTTFDTIRSTIEDVWSVVTGTTGAAWATIQSVVSGAVLVIVSLFTGDFSSIPTIVGTVLETVRGIWGKNADQVGGIVTGLVGRVKSWFADMMNGAQTAVAVGIDGVKKRFGALLGSIQKTFANAPSLLVQAGRNIVAGLANGIREAVGNAVGAARSLASNVIGAARSALGIKSPSTVFREIGQYTAEGMRLGIGDGALAVATAMDSLLATPSPSRAEPLATGFGAAGGSNRPIYMDGSLFGYVQEIADGTARLILNTEATRASAGVKGRYA